MKQVCWSMICIFLLTSCASSAVKTLHVNTEPKGATVSMGEQTCQTPCEITVPKGEEYVLNIQKDGFEDKVVRQFSDWEKNPWVFGAAVVILIGLIATSPSPKEDVMNIAISGSIASLVDITAIDIDVTMKAKE
ncbi:MAG: PEGA domain-containing protein [Ghiorsea sp.]|nr:PEGA domain-containing protein [Ghiorsea sp.]